MTTTWKKGALVTLYGIVVLSFSSCLEKLPTELETALPHIPTPANLSAVVGAEQVTLSWTFDATFLVSGFSVYRSADDQATWEKIGSPVASPFVDSNVRPGTGYWYRVSAVDESGVEGGRSAPLPVVAASYALRINEGEPYTNTVSVGLSVTAPAGTQYMRFSEDSLLTGSTWIDFAPTASFTLSTGDGAKTVYAEFRDALGNRTTPVNASIVLDTYTEIQSLSFTPTSPISPGGTIHLTVVPAGAELDGFAQVFIEGMGSDPVLVYDNGVAGDATAGDGTYEKDFTFALFFRSQRMRLSAIFVDAAGNESADVEFANDLLMTDPPLPVTIYPAVDSTTNSITIRWSASDDNHFARYEVYRDVSPAVSETSSEQVLNQTQVSATTFTDDGLVEGKSYYYAVYVVNDLDESTISNVRMVSTEDIPPSPVTLDSISAIGTDRLTLTWSVNQDSDFLEYRVYRSVTPGVTNSGNLVATIQNRYVTYFDDSGLDTVSNDYYYRIYVYDKALNTSRSNEQSTATPPTP